MKRGFGIYFRWLEIVNGDILKGGVLGGING